MNRNEEYKALRESLEQTPSQLIDTVDRALKKKTTSQRRIRIFGVPAGSLAACFLAFMLLVNLFPPFARACGGVPVLRDLAKAVAWSPSLSAAVEDEFVQPVGQEQSKNGVTARVEYLIVDRKQVNIFYTLTGDTTRILEADAEISGVYGRDLEGFSSSSSSYGTPNGDLRQVEVNFVEQDVPDALTLTLHVYESNWDADGLDIEAPAEETREDTYFAPHAHNPNYLAEFTFELSFDSWFTAQGEMVAVNQTFQIDGQTLTLKAAEIYPTHLRLDFDYAPTNTAWLTGLEFYVENEKGERFDPVTNGISASGEENSPSMVTYWMDTTYFSDSKVLTLHITQARWLEKDRETIGLNLETGDHDPLPDGVKLVGIQHLEQGYLLTFQEKQYREGWMYSMWNGYLDATGTAESFTSSGSSYSYQDPDTGEYLDGSEQGCFYETVPLPAPQAAEVQLKPVFTHVANFTTPVMVSIK